MEIAKGKWDIVRVCNVIAYFLAICTGIMHIFQTGGIITMSSVTLRVTHLMMMITIVLLAEKKNTKVKNNRYNWLVRFGLALVNIACSSYALFVIWPKVIKTGGSTDQIDAVIGLIMVIMLLLVCRRYVAPALTVVAGLFVLYPFVGQWLPGILHGRSFSFARVFNTIFSQTNGIYGIPMGVSATYIVMFSIFGAFLSRFGATDFIFDFSMAVTRGVPGAIAKTAVVSSLMVGTITGSPAGNVAITGSITIPLMKSRGYAWHKAGAFEAIASTGGPIMPPIMGSAAFLMAEITGIRYIQIAKAALLPALLYFLSVFFIAHFDCLKTKIDCTYTPDENEKSIWQILAKGWYFAVPVIMLIVLLVVGYSPLKCAYYSGILQIVVYILHTRRIDKALLIRIVEAIREGVISASATAVACGTAGLIVGILTMTGLGSRVATLIITISGGNLLLALLLVMLTAIVLGMGMPTSPSYLVLATVAAPAMAEMGLPLLASHMFVLFFACISAITPPVALASYVAANIAEANLNKVGWTAFRWGIVSFILPFMFVLDTALLLDGPVLHVLQVLAMSVVGVLCISVANVGYFKTNLPMWQRFLLFGAGVLMIDTTIVTDAIGLTVTAFVVFLNIRRAKSNSLEPNP